MAWWILMELSTPSASECGFVCGIPYWVLWNSVQAYDYYCKNVYGCHFLWTQCILYAVDSLLSVCVHVLFAASHSSETAWQCVSLSVASSAKILSEVLFTTFTAVEDIDNNAGGTASTDRHRERSACSNGVNLVIYCTSLLWNLKR